jgi:hypothetical protein
MYPVFYISPFNDGKKLKTLYDQTPKTRIFAANTYELGSLRLLLGEPEMKQMVYDQHEHHVGKETK